MPPKVVSTKKLNQASISKRGGVRQEKTVSKTASLKSKQEGRVKKDEFEQKKIIPRLQTAEGWKREQLRKRIENR